MATVLFGLGSVISAFYSRGGGGLIRKTKLPMQELELKMQGGLMCEVGRNRGILRYYIHIQDDEPKLRKCTKLMS